MENLLHIGAKLDKETAENAASSIVAVMQAAYETRQTDEVILQAFEVLKSSISVKNITLHGCTFSNDQSKTVEVIVPEDFKVNT